MEPSGTHACCNDNMTGINRRRQRRPVQTEPPFNGLHLLDRTGQIHRHTRLRKAGCKVVGHLGACHAGQGHIPVIAKGVVATQTTNRRIGIKHTHAEPQARKPGGTRSTGGPRTNNDCINPAGLRRKTGMINNRHVTSTLK